MRKGQESFNRTRSVRATRSKKGQAAFEYMTMIGIGLVIIGILVAFSYSWTLASKDALRVSAARATVTNIVESANMVHAQGYPAKTTVLVQIPDRVNAITIINDLIMVTLAVDGSTTDISASSKAPLQGSIGTTSGYFKVQVESFDTYVNISQVT